MSFNSPRTLVKVPQFIRHENTVYEITETPEGGVVTGTHNFKFNNQAKKFIRSKVDVTKCKPGTVRTLANMILYGDKLPKGL